MNEDLIARLVHAVWDQPPPDDLTAIVAEARRRQTRPADTSQLTHQPEAEQPDPYPQAAAWSGPAVHMPDEQAVELLAKTMQFSDLPEKALWRLAAEGTQRTYQEGHLLYHQGDPGDRLLVVLHGLVKLTVASEHGGELSLATLGPPEVLGELSVIDGGPRSSSAQALEPTTVLILPRDAVLDLLYEYPGLAVALLGMLSTMMRRLTEQAADLVFLDLSGRVAKLLARLASERGTREEDALVLDLPLTQSDLARMVGGSRPAVNRILQAFANRGYLEIKGQRVILRDLEALHRRANP